MQAPFGLCASVDNGEHTCLICAVGRAANQEILTLAKSFIMVNVADDEEPRDAGWHPDGSYIPRVFFYDGVFSPRNQ
jgi:hypothetical protein